MEKRQDWEIRERRKRKRSHMKKQGSYYILSPKAGE
jgi:hypothetical protein